MAGTKQDILNNYWRLIKGLKPEWQLDLIERLSQSVRKNLSRPPNHLRRSFGAWESEDSAEEIIDTLRKSRYTNRQIETL